MSSNFERRLGVMYLPEGASALGLISTYNGPMVEEAGELLEPELGTDRGEAGWYRLPDGTRVEWKG